jgi:50S ribosomal subunit-associated GTPase HflX
VSAVLSLHRHQVVGSNYQALEAPNNATYIGSGKVAEVARAVAALKVSGQKLLLLLRVVAADNANNAL